MSHRSDANGNLSFFATLAALSANMQSFLQGANYSAMRTDLGLAIGSDVQAQADVLDDLATLGANSADGEILVGTAAGALAWESGATARTSLGLSIGSDVQAHGDLLDDLNTLGANSADGEFLVGTGAGALAWESGSTARDSLGLGTSDNVQFANITGVNGVFSGNVDISGNLRVQGSKTFIEGEFYAKAANYQLMNAGYTTNSAQRVGIVANYLPTSTQTTTTGAGVFTAGSDGVSDPTVTTQGSGTFSQGDIILISGSSNAANDGLYEVHDHTGTTLTIRSTAAGVTDQAEDFTANDFAAGTDTGATITKVTVAVLRANASGNWEVASGSATGLSFAELAAANGTVPKVRVTSTGTVSGTTEFVLANTSGGSFTYNLPASPADGRKVTFKAAGGNTLTVGRNGENIDGAASDRTINSGDSETYIYDTTDGWSVV